MNKPLFKLYCVVHGYLVSFYMSRLGGEGGNALSCDVLSFRPAHLPMQQQQEQQVQFLAALDRFQRLVVLRQHIRDTIVVFDDVTDQWETHPDLYDQPTAHQLQTIRLALHTLCQQIGRELTQQQTQLQGFLQVW